MDQVISCLANKRKWKLAFWSTLYSSLPGSRGARFLEESSFNDKSFCVVQPLYNTVGLSRGPEGSTNKPYSLWVFQIFEILIWGPHFFHNHSPWLLPNQQGKAFSNLAVFLYWVKWVKFLDCCTTSNPRILSFYNS